MLTEDEKKDLIAKSVEAKARAYAPYSNFKVGAALLTEGGNVYTGVSRRLRQSQCQAHDLALILFLIGSGTQGY